MRQDWTDVEAARNEYPAALQRRLTSHRHAFGLFSLTFAALAAYTAATFEHVALGPSFFLQE
jgi:hypothetical protein